MCGVLTNVVFNEDKKLYAAINSKTANEEFIFAEETIILPENLSNLAKKQRWKKLWFNNASIE